MKSQEFIEVMISSQCKEIFPDSTNSTTFSDIRKELKNKIESTRLFDKPIFKVWINEETISQPMTEDWWAVCKNEAKDCDIFISLYNGHAGSTLDGGDVGICEHELVTAHSHAPGKVRVIEIGDTTEERARTTDRNMQTLDNRFYSEIMKLGPFWSTAMNFVELEEQVKAVLFDVLIKLAEGGKRELSKGKAYLGLPLEWRRLNYIERKQAMERALRETIESSSNHRIVEGYLVEKIGEIEVLFIPSAIPDSMSVSQAREMVGQPFLDDYKLAPIMTGEFGGPVHIIACYAGATETQAKKLLGFPDATIIPAPFGVYVADNIQKIQFAFIAKCDSEVSTKTNYLEFIKWLKQGGEEKFLTERALSRAKIVRAIYDEYKK